MKIGELAKQANCTVETIRYYEREGLLPPTARTEGNFRAYGPQHAERLRFIRNCRALDMSHEEIRQLLALADDPAMNCAAVNEVFDAHIAHVEVRIRELKNLKDTLQSLRRRCMKAGAVDACGILQGMVEMETGAQPARRHTHLG